MEVIADLEMMLPIKPMVAKEQLIKAEMAAPAVLDIAGHNYRGVLMALTERTVNIVRVGRVSIVQLESLRKQELHYTQVAEIAYMEQMVRLIAAMAALVIGTLKAEMAAPE